MACRWRIRHKLMLGLGLVIAIISLLLVGTFKGLSSYQATMRAFDSKLQELQKANELRDVIKDLGKANRDLATEYFQLKQCLGEVRKSLAAYEAQLEKTIRQKRDLDDGYGERGTVKDLTEHLDEWEKAVDKAHERPRVAARGRNLLVQEEEVKAAFNIVFLDAGDLSNRIYDNLDKRMRLAKRDYKISFGVVIFISVSGVLLMASLMRGFYCWIFTPIRKLKYGVDRVAQGDFELNIDVQSSDEMKDLAVGFNYMTQRLRESYQDLTQQVNDRSKQLIRSERLASVGFLAAGVAHEINNPLASIAFCSEALEHRLEEVLSKNSFDDGTISPQDRATMTRYLKMIQDESFRCKEITQRLLEFSKGGERRREPVDLAEIIQGVLEVVQHLQNCKGKNLVFDVNDHLIAVVNAQEIKSVILNLVVNALESMDEGGTLTITQQQKSEYAELTFADTGCGMSEDTLENIFEPFFTRSRTGKGTGLGLSISHRIISQHGGEIEASSPGPNHGSTFFIRIPLRQVPDTSTDPDVASEDNDELNNRPDRRAA